MNKTITRHIIQVFLFVGLVIPNNIFAQKLERMQGNLNEYLQPIDSTSDGLDYHGVADYLAQYPVLGLGEGTHGTKDFFEGKTQIIMTLIKKGLVKTVYIETEFVRMSILNDSLQNPVVKKMESPLKQTLFGIYRTKEIGTLLQGIKNYNLSCADSERVSVYGMGAHVQSLSRRILGKGSPFVSLDESSRHHLAFLDTLFSEYSGDTVPLDDSVREANKKLITKLRTIVDEAKDSIAAFYVNLLEKGIYIGTAKNPVERNRRRDHTMAENIIWIQDNLATEGNSVVWAHNSHIAKVELNTIHKMGYYLKEYYGENYYSLAFTFNKGEVNFFGEKIQYPATNNKRAIEYVLAGCKPENFFLNVGDLLHDEKLVKRLSRYYYMRTIGATQMNKTFFYSPLVKSFDGVIFLDKTTGVDGF